MRRPLFLLLLACSPPPEGPIDGGSDAGADAGRVEIPPSRPAPEPLIDHVDPFIGTGGFGFNNIGSTYPGPQRPFGLVRPGPDTTADTGAPEFLHCSGFRFEDPYVTGFSHTRMTGTGIADYGAVTLMPVAEMDPSYVSQNGYRSPFGDREASPGYFSIQLTRDDVRVELTTTDHVAMHRYTYAAGASQAVLVDNGHFLADGIQILDGSVTIDEAAREISGFVHFSGSYSDRFGGMPVYFVARFDRAFATHGVWEETTLHDAQTSALGGHSGAWVTFDPAGGAVLNVEVAISFVDLEGARANLAAESAPFDDVREASEAAWERELGRARIEAREDRDFVQFYTALYHALLMPTLASDADGRYRGIDREIHTADGYRYYTDFSLWDTFRTLHPLLTLLYPDYQTDMLRSLAAMGADAGTLPRWALGIGETGGMLGDPAAIVLADSYVKGLRDFDLRTAYDALRRSADGVPGEIYDGRGNAEVYARLGYVPIEAAGSSTSKTLEFAYADWALATLAEALGETADAERYATRAGNWRNSWDPERQFFIGRYEDGTFEESFRDDTWQPFYAEGNAWQYVWYAPHDLEGLAEIMGGRDAFLARLTMFFDETQDERRTALPPHYYWHGNEPDLHAAFIFSALGEGGPSARLSRWIARTVYGDGPLGLPGNDDGGTMSAWLVFAYLGFFTIAGEDHYLLGSPIATHAELEIDGGTFVIDAPDASEAAVYVGEARLDGVLLTAPRFLHADVHAGGRLELDMTNVE